MLVLTVFSGTDSEAMTKKTKEYQYDVNDNGDIEITKCTGKTHITSVTLPDSVSSINWCAFLDCKKLALTR